MRKSWPWAVTIVCVWLALGFLANRTAALAAEQPNIILINCDDLGYADIGCFAPAELGYETATHGAKQLDGPKHRTPNIDRLAAEGIRLTDFYSTCGVCTPSRASLMTGCYPKRISMHESERGQWVLFPGNRRGLSSDETTMAEALRAGGYATAIVGKWHLGDQPPYLPTKHGFDRYFGIPFSNDMGKMDRPYTNYPPTPLLRDDQVIELEPDQRYLTQRYTAEALEFIRDHRDQPFFLYLPHSMPHWPQYARNAFADQSGNGHWGDSIMEIDWSTGEILDELKRLDLDSRTLIVFTSDNGGATQHGANNAPLRGSKGSTWEGGHRVCFVARWPGKIEQGSVASAMAVTVDLLPTFCEIAGVPLPDKKIDGQDIGPILRGESNETPHEYYLYYFRGQLAAVRSGRWKMFVKGPGRYAEQLLETPQLFDLQTDIAETTDVAAQHPEVIAKLQTFVQQARRELGDGSQHAGEAVRDAGLVEQATTLTLNAPAKMQTQSLFSRGDNGYHTYRIPALITTNDNTVLAFCEARKKSGSDHGDIDLVLRRSHDQGQTWDAMSVVYEEGDTAPITIGNPCPVVDRGTGTIWLPFCRNNDTVWMTHSDDDGATWSPPTDITQQVKRSDWGWYATGPGIGIQMTRTANFRGRLVIPCDHREQIDGQWVKKSHAFFSDDHGETWQLGESVADHTDECQVVELRDGRLMMNMRNYWSADGGQKELGGKRAVAISDDGGATWGPLSFDDQLPEPVCQASIVRYSRDHFRPGPLLFTNPASTSKRVRLTIRQSFDEGKSWPADTILHQGPAAYSSLSIMANRSVACLYEAGEESAYESIRFTQFPLKLLPRPNQQ